MNEFFVSLRFVVHQKRRRNWSLFLTWTTFLLFHGSFNNRFKRSQDFLIQDFSRIICVSEISMIEIRDRFIANYIRQYFFKMLNTLQIWIHEFSFNRFMDHELTHIFWNYRVLQARVEINRRFDIRKLVLGRCLGLVMLHIILLIIEPLEFSTSNELIEMLNLHNADSWWNVAKYWTYGSLKLK